MKIVVLTQKFTKKRTSNMDSLIPSTLQGLTKQRVATSCTRYIHRYDKFQSKVTQSCEPNELVSNVWWVAINTMEVWTAKSLGQLRTAKTRSGELWRSKRWKEDGWAFQSDEPDYWLRVHIIRPGQLIILTSLAWANCVHDCDKNLSGTDCLYNTQLHNGQLILSSGEE